ncbi:MAG: GNAT family N-acetyltransferase [Succinivibrio sp.]
MSQVITVKGNLQINVRWANVGDAAKIARLELNSSRFENRKTPLMYTFPQFTELWESRLNDDVSYKTILAAGPTGIYGFLTFKEKIESGKILALYIDPLYMRHGIGTVLLSIAEQMIRSRGGKLMQVEVEVLNNSAIAFYKSLHFAKVRVELEHLIVMQKEL